MFCGFFKLPTLSFYKKKIRQRQLSYLLCGQSGESCWVGRSVGKIIIIITLSFRVGTSENKNIDHRVKESYAIMSTQITCETDHFSLLMIQQCKMN